MIGFCSKCVNYVGNNICVGWETNIFCVLIQSIILGIIGALILSWIFKDDIIEKK